MKPLTRNTISAIVLLSIFLAGCGNRQDSAEKKEINHTDASSAQSLDKTDSFERYKKSGISKTEVEDFKGAVEDITLALHLNPEVTSLYFYRGHSYYKLNRHKEAIDDFTKAIELQPNGIYYNSRGIARDALGYYKDALKDFDKALEMIPGDAEFYYYRGLTKLHLNNKKGACLDWEKSDELGYDDAIEQLDSHCR